MRTKVAQVGLDVHKTFSRLTQRDAEGKVIGRGRLDHKDHTRLREHLRELPEGTPVVLEATFAWGWMSDELTEANLKPQLANSAKVAAWRKARGIAKTDRTDADLCSELPFEKSDWWQVWLAPQEVRDQREWMRYRSTLVGIQTSTKNRIHAVLHRHGIAHGYSDLFGVAGRKFLGELAAPTDATLRPSARQTLRGYLALLEGVRSLIAQATREFRRQLNETPLGGRLRSIPGICWILAYVIMAEVGKIERFKNARHLCSYSLLVPRAYDTGNDDKDEDTPKGRHVGFVGRRTLKWAFIEAAHGAVRRRGRFREIFDRVTDGGRKDRNRGYITVAHELCRMVYVVWSKGVSYRPNPPARPGQDRSGCGRAKRKSKQRRKTRSGMGQPVHPMVVAP